jgi:4-amino-4-deoxy-L-arabinose transferase-like glycosyltransferase
MPRKSFVTYLLLLFFFLCLILPSFFYKLGASSLVSFDEAWYAAVARNIRTTKDPLNLYFNGSRFVDHPPAGFWFIAATQAIFGDNEFGSRAAAAILGLAALVLIFILGTLISSPAVGLASVVALSSSPWFIYRSRSGNLDITLTFYFLLTFILAISASKNKKFLIPLAVSLAFLILTKTMVPFTILPSLVIIFWNSTVIFSREFILSITIAITLTLTWFISQLINYPGFISKYFIVGLPKSKPTTILDNILLTKTYLHEGIGSFFRPIIFSLPLSLFIKNKYFYSLLLFTIIFIIPFFFSSRGQIWHLIPVYPFLILIFFTVLYLLLKSYLISRSSLVSALIITLSLLISGPQILKNWNDFINIPAYISDEAILSREASRYLYPLSIDDRFLPVAVYYSGKVVNDLPTPDIGTYFDNSKPFLLITHQWRLDQKPGLKSRYQLLRSDRDMVLILINPADTIKTQSK